MTASRVAEHFESLPKQTRLGMWVFLATEVLLFAGLFVAYAVYRYLFTAEFLEGSRHLKLWIGTLNTFVLLGSSFLVAMALHYARIGRMRVSALLIGATALLGLTFLGLKALEYYQDIVEGLLPGRMIAIPEFRSQGAGVFVTLYYLMTGLHALHVTVGMSVLIWIGVLAWRGAYSAEYHTPIELGGMYWHLVDVVWIFLWPLLYLL